MLELSHLGYALHEQGRREGRTIKAATAVFDGARGDQIKAELEAADGDRLIGENGKQVLYNGRTAEPYDRPITTG